MAARPQRPSGLAVAFARLQAGLAALWTRLDAPLGWDRFNRLWLALAGGLAAALVAIVLIADPYGIRTRAGTPAAAILDLNQRYMYPRIPRSRIYDSAVFGTSTVRLLDPARLDALFGGRFANLAMNAATPWETTQLMRLFLRKTPAPKLVILGLDPTWCEEDADSEAKRLTARSFPPWLYDDRRLNDIAPHLSLKSLEITGRVVAHALGLMPPRIRADGYEVFTPPEGSYDLARARVHLWGGTGTPVAITPTVPPVVLTEAERTALRLPAVTWAAETLGHLPDEARVILVFPPVHIAAQPRPGSREAAIEAECKGRFAALARNRGSALVDFRLASRVTRSDANYWDPLHYREPVAVWFGEALREAYIGLPSAESTYRLLTRRPD